MTEIRILIYLDKSEHVAEVTKLREILETKKSEFVVFKLCVVNRYKDAVPGQIPTPVRIDKELLKDFDQVWFFGYFQENAGAEFGIYGSNQNELRDDEVGELKVRMDEHRLGVLISGDHSDDRPTGATGDPAKFFGLGKAIGARVPRAKQLRTWDGPPTGTGDDTTISTIAEAAPSSTPPERDTTPQKVSLFNFAAGSFGYLPHRLFWGKDETGQDRVIDVLPDHQHEGAVVIPASLDGDWPPKSEPDGTKKRPRPFIVALGFASKVNRAVPVLAVYDGDSHSIGRIVADSSWHHFYNTNLEGISKDTSPGSAFDLIGQFYRNLAHYLAPLEKRQQIAREMLMRVITHPGVMEERGGDRVRLGRAARSFLSRVATPFEVAEMLHVELPDEFKLTASHVEFARLASDETNLLPSQEEIIGSIVGLYYKAASERLKAELEGTPLSDSDNQRLGDKEVIDEGFKEAFRVHADRLVELASASPDFSDRLERAGKLKEVMMATVCTGTDHWEESKKNNQREGRFDITKSGSTFTGMYFTDDGEQVPLRNVRCGGEGGTLSFDWESKKKKKDMFYEGTIKRVNADKFTVTGTFREVPLPTPPGEGQGRKQDEDVTPPVNSNDWSAEKPGA